MITEEQVCNQNIKDAYFDVDKSSIRPDASQALKDDANFLNEYAEIKFMIEGYADERGREEHNLRLAGGRAASARDFLVSLGVSADRITVSHPEGRRFCTEHDEDCWQKNRRVHFVCGSKSK